MKTDNDFQLIEVTDQHPAQWLVHAEGFPVTIANLDPQNTVILGNNKEVQPKDHLTVPLGPGTAIPFSGINNVYGICMKNQSAAVLVIPGATGWFGSTGQSPSSVPPSVASTSIGSAGNTPLIGAALNPNQLAIQLVSMSITSIAVTTSPAAGQSAFTVEDGIYDSNGKQYLPCEIGLPGVAANQPYGAVNSNNMNFNNTIVPAGLILNLVNGGAGGTTSLRRCSGTVSYYLIGQGS